MNCFYSGRWNYRRFCFLSISSSPCSSRRCSHDDQRLLQTAIYLIVLLLLGEIGRLYMAKVYTGQSDC